MTKHMDIQPWLSLHTRSPCQSSACSLTNPPDHFMMESECIYNGLAGMFVVSWVKIDQVVFSLAIHTDRQPYMQILIMKKKTF